MDNAQDRLQEMDEQKKKECKILELLELDITQKAACMEMLLFPYKHKGNTTRSDIEEFIAQHE